MEALQTNTLNLSSLLETNGMLFLLSKASQPAPVVITRENYANA
jgi:hypothetical protein